MRTLHLATDDYEHLLRTLLDAQHFFHAFDQTEVRQEGETYTFEAAGFTKALERTLGIVGWRAGDPMPPGLPFERLSPRPLEPGKPGQ
ncbi:MAG: hypothetical protein JWQ76_4539 [Ramlibacter sp.]|nr:hypothetical protein [Ramlibacter sp.]